MAIYSYYDYLVNYYHDYYDYYYEYYYWPVYYGVYNVSNDSWCDYNATHHHYNMSNMTSTTTTSPLNYNDTWMTSTPLPYQSTMATHYYNTTIFNASLNCTPRYNGTFPPHGYPYEQWWYHGMHIIGPALTGCTFLFAILSIVIAVFFFKQLKIAMKKKGRLRPDTLTVVLSSTCMIAHVLYNLFDIPAYWYWYFHYDVEAAFTYDMIWELFWCLAKVMIYSLYAYRYYMLQQASIHNRATKNARNIRFGLIGVCILVQIALEVMYCVNYYDFSSIQWDDPGYAEKQRKYLNAGWGIMIIDFVLVMFLGYLIMRTILQLVIAINDPAHKSMSTKTHETTHTDNSAASAPVQSTAGSASAPTRNPTPASGPSGSGGSAPKSPRFRVWSISLRSKSGITSEERRKKRSSRQMNLIQVTTRIALTCMISLLSSLFMQFMWIIMEETENYGILFFSYFWGLDAVVNMLCVYFSMAFAKQHYLKVCGDILRCHYCCLWCIMRLVGHKTDDKEIELGREDETTNTGGAGQDPIDLSDVSPPSPRGQVESASDPKRDLPSVDVDVNETR